MKAHIIAITSPVEEKRLELRRQSDVSAREKAKRFDEIVEQSRIYFDLFIAEHRKAIQKAEAGSGQYALRRYVDDARRMAALAHEHWQVLKLAGVTDLVCPCAYCQISGELIGESPERMTQEAEACGKNGATK